MCVLDATQQWELWRILPNTGVHMQPICISLLTAINRQMSQKGIINYIKTGNLTEKKWFFLKLNSFDEQRKKPLKKAYLHHCNGMLTDHFCVKSLAGPWAAGDTMFFQSLYLCSRLNLNRGGGLSWAPGQTFQTWQEEKKLTFPRL